MNCQCKACLEVMSELDKVWNYDGDKSCPNCGGVRFSSTELPLSDRYTQNKYERLLEEIKKAEGFIVNDEPSYKIEKGVWSAGTLDIVVIELKGDQHLFINERMLREARTFDDGTFLVKAGGEDYMMEAMYH